MTKKNEQPDSVQAVALPELEAAASGPDLLNESRLDVIKNVNVNLEVVVGAASLTVDEVFNLKQGSVVTLDRDADAPLDIVLDGKVVARGDLVVVGERFGIRISELKS